MCFQTHCPTMPNVLHVPTQAPSFVGNSNPGDTVACVPCQPAHRETLSQLLFGLPLRERSATPALCLSCLPQRLSTLMVGKELAPCSVHAARCATQSMAPASPMSRYTAHTEWWSVTHAHTRATDPLTQSPPRCAHQRVRRSQSRVRHSVRSAGSVRTCARI